MSAETVAVEVTLVPLRARAPMVGSAFELLDAHERTAACAREGNVRRRYVVAHAAARTLLAARLGTDPACVAIAREPAGRPSVDGVAFNLSHSGDRCAIALARPGLALGVDLERVRARPHLDLLARRVLGPDEYDAWAALAPRARPRAFAQRWTEVEAVLKARGTGIAGGLASAREAGRGWSCRAFDAGAGYAGAVAVDAPAVAVTTRTWRLGDPLTDRDGTAR